MAQPFDLLPVELQASVIDLRSVQVPESTIDAFVERMLTALASKSNRVQVEVWEMEERLGKQLSQIGDKLQMDIQTQLGATNGMLIDLRSVQLQTQPAIEEARQGVAELKKNWDELDTWRSRVEATLASFAESRQVSIGKHTQTQSRLTSIEARLAEIERLMEIANHHESGG